VRVACEAMGTRFEIVVHGDDPVRLRAAGEAAMHEIQRLDCQLSFYRPDSELSWLNARAARAPVQVEPGFFGLLERCLQLTEATDGAFDITVAPLMRAWRFVNGDGRLPDGHTLAAARALVGRGGVELDVRRRTVRFTRPGVALELGAAGKGYAIDRAMSILAEHEVASALMHGGTSSIHATGNDPGRIGWTVTWAARPLALRNEALSVSAPHGKCFREGGRTYGHVLDPRSGEPVLRTASALVTGPRSLECDALSTAVLVLGPDWLPTLGTRFPAYRGMLAS
jgi:thiamine biosynthesis lipoprotein